MTPADKGDADLVFETSTIRSSADGRRVTFQTPASYPGDRGSFIPNQGLGSLTPQGWTTQGVMPAVDPDWAGGSLDNRQGYQTFADDLSGGAFVSPGPALTDDAATRMRNIYRTDFASGGYSLLTPAPITPLDPLYRLFYSPAVAAATPDLGHVVYETSGVELTSDAPVGASSAYEWAGGEVRLVGILPDGTVAPGGAVPGRGVGGGFFGSTNFEQYQSGVISEDGSRVFFTTPGTMGGFGAAGTIYVRENGSSTRLVSVSKRATPDPEGPQPATFLAASPDGRVVLFLSTEKLTDDSNANSGRVSGGVKPEVYRYDIDADSLLNLSAEMPYAEALVGTDRSLTTVYFGGNNEDIFMWRNGVTKRVATRVMDGGAADRLWPMRLQIKGKQSEVSPDGRFMVYWAVRPQGGIDPGAAGQLFLYDADADTTTCLTCPPADEPGGESLLRPFQYGGAFIRPYMSRNFSSDSSLVFFETPQALVPEDSNRKVDVYQYNLLQRRAELVSTGTGDTDSHFGDASADGTSVFFTTQQQVIPGLDDDRFSDLYVARVGATKHVSTSRLPCAGDDCQGPLSPAPQDPVAASAVFTHSDDSGDDPARVAVFRVAPISSRQQRTWARSGRLNLSVRVSDAGRVNATVSGKLGKRASVLARASKTARGGGNVQLMLRLSRPARQYLAKRGKLRVTIAVSYSDGGGTQRATLLLRHPSRSTTTTRGAR